MHAMMTTITSEGNKIKKQLIRVLDVLDVVVVIGLNAQSTIKLDLFLRN